MEGPDFCLSQKAFYGWSKWKELNVNNFFNTCLWYYDIIVGMTIVAGM